MFSRVCCTPLLLPRLSPPPALAHLTEGHLPFPSLPRRPLTAPRKIGTELGIA
ncbi:hypothetical protein K523DRAFT_358864 [Schizophyllum commune Tattone D]|nr:hypothetical protein K523DRAFT_358864 [Schizophyllum commune Tattone D]